MNPVEIKHWEILQALGERDLDREDVERDLYRELVDTYGMCPWLAAAGYLCGQRCRHRRPLLLAYLNADHSSDAKWKRQRWIADEINKDFGELADYEHAVAGVQAWRGRSGFASDVRALRRLVIRLHPWRSL